MAAAPQAASKLRELINSEATLLKGPQGITLMADLDAGCTGGGSRTHQAYRRQLSCRRPRRPWSCEPASRSSSRAVLAGRTFFRYFSDKREALFAGSDELRAVLVEKILQVPDVGEPLQVVIGALSEFDWENLGSRNSQRQRQAVIAANPELLERDLIKNHSIAVGFIDALRQRGVDADIAGLAAHVGIQLFITAYVHWLEAGAKADLAMMSERAMSLLASIVPTNARPPSSRQKSARVPANQADPSPRRGRVPHDPGAAIKGKFTGRPR